MTLFDYVTSYGVYTFKQKEFNEIDNAVLNMITYLSWESIVSSIPHTLSFCANKYFLKYKEEPAFATNESKSEKRMLLALIANSRRYKNILVSNYVKIVSTIEVEQFVAITYKIGLFEYYISFQGTDGTVLGWREDFDMSYKMPIPSQKDASLYLKAALKKQGKFIVGGHSKGGNLAIYAAVENNCKRIITIYNNDGPGFSKEYVECENYKNNVEKIIHVVPESSMVGIIMNHGNCKQVIIDSVTSDKPMQHNMSTWSVSDSEFKRADKLSEYSLNLQKIAKSWYENLSVDEKKIAIDLIYSVLNELNIETVFELQSRRKEVVSAVYQAFKNYDKQAKKAIFAKLLNLMKANGGNILGAFKNRKGG